MHKESTYTKPRKDCSNPELWSAPNGQATEIEITKLIQSMIVALKPKIVLEAGTHEAHTSIAIAEALMQNKRGKLYTIEINENKSQKAKRKLSGLPAQVINADCLKYKPDYKIDFIFVDGLPTPERIKEWLHYKKYLSNYAVAMFHDTGPHRVFRKALDEDKELTVVHLPTPRGVSIGYLNN